MTDKLVTASIDVYLSKQEGLVVEYIRKALQAETKVAMLEEALTQAKQKLEQATAQNDTCSSTLEQSIAGLQALQVEKERFKTEVIDLSKQVTELHSIAESERRLQEENVRLKRELEETKSKYNTAIKAHNGLAQELEYVKTALEATKVELEVMKKPNLIKPKKQTSAS